MLGLFQDFFDQGDSGGPLHLINQGVFTQVIAIVLMKVIAVVLVKVIAIVYTISRANSAPPLLSSLSLPFYLDCDCQVGVTSFGSVFGCEVNMHAGFTRCQYGSVDDDDDVYDMSGHGTSCTKRQSSFRDDICHKHHKQRLCKIIITRVKVHFVNVV